MVNIIQYIENNFNSNYMDWTDWETNKILNDKLSDNQDDFKIIMETENNIFNLIENDVINSINNINNKILYFITGNVIYTSNNIKEYLKFKLNINPDTTFDNILNNLTIIPIINNIYNIYEYYDLITKNIKKSDKILIYYDNDNKLKRSLKNFNYNNYDDYNNNISSNNYDIWYCSNLDNYKQNSCDWYMYKIPWYINQLIYISKFCKEGATCIFTFDFRFLNIMIYKQLIGLFACFMKLKIYNDRLMIFKKLILIGEELDLNKLSKWCKTKNILTQYVPSFETKDNFCISIKPVIASLNINLDSNLDSNIKDVYDKYIEYNNKRLKILFADSLKYNNFSDNIINVINQTTKNIINYLKQYPFEINSYYTNKSNICCLKSIDFNKLYFDNKSQTQLEQLQISNQQLYNIMKPKSIIKVAKIIRKQCKKKSIIDMTAYSGLFGLSFCKKFKNVICINIDYENYKILNSNINICGADNIKSIHQNSIKYLFENKKKYKLLFFDLTKNNVIEKDSQIIKYDDQTVDQVISILLDNCENINIFILVANKKSVQTKYKEFKINKFYLLYFTNTKL